jgi:hypothetical protein
MSLSPRILRSTLFALAGCAVAACSYNAPVQRWPATAPEAAPKVSVSPHLIHRYSFTTDASDSIGKINGSLVGPATIANGSLVLKGEAAPASLEFPASLLPAGTSTTLVVWFTSTNAGNFSRLINFGGDDGTVANAFIYLTPHTTNGNTRVAISAELTATKTFIDADTTDDGKPHMIAVVIGGADSKLHLFIDGVEPKPAADLGANTLDKVARKDNWVGKSPFAADIPLNASIDELRVYDHAMSADEVMLNFKAGADTLPPAK